ncbi:hypothetical protein [Aquimarina sp. RZ0]|uniref:hypothetical protein n=1 Tax=Aquimarina sp. RZ0 TaxID=2607730 RepID=UPI0011F236C7|nr:hypothetical protein [Aquimarina sp. RZ0]KAA1246444.1 hypothetical protein F0000_07495 [Aquimarina sp. RZ0]
MPHKMRLMANIVLVGLLFTITCNAQQYDCAIADKSGFIKKAFDSFEKDLFDHYKFDSDSVKTYRTFLAEVASLSLDLRKLPSDNSIQLARTFKKKANDKNSIWVKLSDYESRDATKKTSTYTPSPEEKDEEVLIFNYRGGFIQCLKNTSNSDDFKKIIYTLENDGNVSTSLIAQKVYYMVDKEINTSQVKEFIAFDIYYSILMVIEKAFG